MASQQYTLGNAIAKEVHKDWVIARTRLHKADIAYYQHVFGIKENQAKEFVKILKKEVSVRELIMSCSDPATFIQQFHTLMQENTKDPNMEWDRNKFKRQSTRDARLNRAMEESQDKKRTETKRMHELADQRLNELAAFPAKKPRFGH